MRTAKALAIVGIAALLGAAIVAVSVLVEPAPPTGRGVRLDQPQPLVTNALAFDRSQSAGLFVGVRNFSRGGIAEVPFAADDAVDLAHMFALDPRVSLVLPEHVVIALSGRPRKKESKQRLDELEARGAKVEQASPADILTLLQRQAATAGKDGILIVSLATHGFIDDGIPHVLGSASVFQHPETAVRLPRLLELAALSDARRSLFFIDACRERIAKGVRSGAAAASRAPNISRLGRSEGQVVFYAAAAGGFAYDDNGNGVFTKAVLEGLQCNAALTRGAVTVEKLHQSIERFVHNWIRKNRDLGIGPATQIVMDGNTKNLRLAICGEPPPPPAPDDLVRATHDGSVVSAFSASNTRLWFQDVRSPISGVRAEDLDLDGSREVILGAEGILVLDHKGKLRWSKEEGVLRTFLVEDLSHRDATHQVVALWDDPRQPASRVAMYDAKGQSLFHYDHPGRLQHLRIDRPNSHHKRRIVVTGVDETAGLRFGIRQPLASVTVLNSHYDKPEWTAVLLPPSERIASLEIADSDNDSNRDITLTTTSGKSLHVDFDGRVLDKSSPRLQFRILPRKARRLPAP